MKLVHSRGKIGCPIDFVYTKEEVYILKVVQSLISYKPKEVNPILFDNFTIDYMLEVSWILKWKIKSLENINFPYDYSMVQAVKPRSILMRERLNICFGLFNLMEFSSYLDVWQFWFEVEMDWKRMWFEATNKDAETGCNTKKKITSVNRNFKQLLQNNKNPYKKSTSPHLFTMIDASLRIMDTNSENYSREFKIDYWNPFIDAVKHWFDNDYRKTWAWNLSQDKKTLLASIGGRKKEIIYKPDRPKNSGRGRKKREKEIYNANDFLSFDIPGCFGDLSYLECQE